MSIKNRLARYLLPAGLIVAASAFAQEPFVISNFDDKVPENALASKWGYLTDNDSHGNSRITTYDSNNAMIPLIDSMSFGAGHGASGSSLLLGFVYGDSLPHGDGDDTGHYDPEVGLETVVYDSLGMMGGSIAGATKITFWAKADKNLKARFIVGQTSILDYAYYGQDFNVTTEWKQITINLAASSTFAQPDWKSASVPFQADSVNAFEFNISKAFNPVAGATFYLDDFTIYGWKYHASGIRLLPAGSRAGLRAFQKSGILHVTLPEAYRNAAGSVQVVGVTGAELMRAGFAKGQKELEIKLDAAAAGAARKFLRVLPAGR
jgi:hypothetical protein